MNTVLLPTYTLWKREIVRFYRQPNRIIGALGPPLLFWLLIGAGYGPSFRPDGSAEGVSYLQYFYPGIVALTVLFTAIFSMISIIEDRQEGFLQSVIVSPIHRESIVLGKVLGGSTLGLFQGVIFLFLAPVVGFSLTVVQALELTGIILLMSIGLTGLGFLMAWMMDSVQGFHGLMNLLLMPMWLLSGAMFPLEGLPGWLRAMVAINPLTYGISAFRHALQPDLPASSGMPSFLISLIVTVAFAFLALIAASVGARRRT